MDAPSRDAMRGENRTIPDADPRGREIHDTLKDRLRLARERTPEQPVAILLPRREWTHLSRHIAQEMMTHQHPWDPTPYSGDDDPLAEERFVQRMADIARGTVEGEFYGVPVVATDAVDDLVVAHDVREVSWTPPEDGAFQGTPSRPWDRLWGWVRGSVVGGRVSWLVARLRCAVRGHRWHEEFPARRTGVRGAEIERRVLCDRCRLVAGGIEYTYSRDDGGGDDG